jgi:hypothetical protein
MILKWYNAYKSWPIELQQWVVRAIHAVGFSVLTLLANHYYYDQSWETAIGALIVVILSGQIGLSQVLPKSVKKIESSTDQ